jgi:type VI secretion system protein ImpA
MPSPATLELDALAAPIPGDSPVGIDLRTDESVNSVYYNLRALRQECRDEERQVDAGNIEPVSATRWEELAQGCQAALKEKSKDLEITCWLLEALARIPREPASGGVPVSEFAALRDGFKLVNALCTQYWDTMWSVQDESDPDAKARPLIGLNEGALITPIRKIPLTKREHPGPFSYWQIDVLQKKSQTAEVEQLVRIGARPFYEPMLTDIAEARAALTALEETMRTRMNASAANISEALDQVQRMVQHISGIKLGDAAAAAAASGDAPAAAARAGGGVRVDGEFGSRDEALEALVQIARFFREREPQAPISYTIEDAVRRARMPLNDLLGELLDDDSRRRMLLNAGIMPPKSE